jgi:hypothetical protein
MYMGSGEIWVMRSTGGDIHPWAGSGGTSPGYLSGALYSLERCWDGVPPR